MNREIHVGSVGAPRGKIPLGYPAKFDRGSDFKIIAPHEGAEGDGMWGF